jgi:hypothetical protein
LQIFGVTILVLYLIMISSSLLGGKKLKPEYEKPIAMPLGEALKGSGECKEGSAVKPGAGYTDYDCTIGYEAYSCVSGSVAVNICAAGTGDACCCHTGSHAY